ncbi:MAG: 50S ribosomal protein L4, partial [Nitrospinota bacterium]
MEIPIVDAQGNEVERRELNATVFAAEVKPHLLHEVVTMQLANR